MSQPRPTTPIANSAAPKSAGPRVRLLFAEDHPVVRKGILAFLESQPTLEIVGEAKDGKEALRKAHELSPDLLLMDMDMPQLNGLAVTEILHKELPKIKVLLLSGHSGARFVLRILQAGARGYLLKEASAQDMVNAIQVVAAGGTCFGPEFAQVALTQLVRKNTNPEAADELTEREREVLVLIADGLYNKEIADRLGVSTRTVETHRENLMNKLKIHSTAGLIRFAVANGLVLLPEMPPA
ncbi:MAG TPA: response regulator transcription factor [Verrucomicrobiae bacterium]|nr:response regulator transcription factor [Verrucomicrobiae bacterium]